MDDICNIHTLEWCTGMKSKKYMYKEHLELISVHFAEWKKANTRFALVNTHWT